MLDKTIEQHIDKMDIIEDDLQKDIDAIYATINIDRVIEDPQKELLRVSDEVKKLIIDKYSEQAAEAGIELGKDITESIKTGDEIEVQDTDNPKENEDDFSDTRQD